MSKASDKTDPRQRQLGAVVPEVVGESLPERLAAIPTSVAGYDGWTADQVADRLKGVEGAFRLARLQIGLALWVLRDMLPGEKEYEVYAEDLAAVYDVTVDTLTRWRGAAQRDLGLPDPAGAAGKTKAAVAGRAAQTKPRRPKSGAPTRATFVSANPPTPSLASTVIEATASEVLTPKPLTAPVSKMLTTDLETVIGALIDCKPADIRSLDERLFARFGSWVQQAWAVRPAPTVAIAIARSAIRPAPPAASPRPRREDTSAGAAKCLHPVTRRIGDRCGACGAATKAGR